MELLMSLRVSITVLFFSIPLFTAAQIQLEPPLLLEQSDQELHFSINNQHVMVFDSEGDVHLVYFIPDDVSSPPENRMFYLHVDDGVITEALPVTHSVDSGGGRHPSLIIDANDTIHVTWQDYRHTSAFGNYIDNTEIYYNRKFREGEFSDTDIRISNTNAAHLGDNGFVPVIEVDSAGRVHIIWYDFNRNGSNAEVYLRSSDDAGEFADETGIEQFRITNLHNGSETVSHWMPTMISVSEGLYTVWGRREGFTGTLALEGCLISAEGDISEIDPIGTGGTFLDPPRLAADQQGNIAMVYARREDDQWRITMQYKPAGQSWSEPMDINQSNNNSTQPNLSFDDEGNLFIVWQEAVGFDQIRLAKVNPVSGTILFQQSLTTEEVDAKTPVIAFDSTLHRMTIAWIQQVFDSTEWQMVLVQQEVTAVLDWSIYD